MIIKTQTHYTIVYNQNWEQIANSGEGEKFLCTEHKHISWYSQVPTATLSDVTGFWGAINDPFQVGQMGSISNSTRLWLTHTSRSALLLILSFSWGQRLEIVSVCPCCLFDWSIVLPSACQCVSNLEDTVLSRVVLTLTFPSEHPTSYLALQLVAVENNQSFIKKPHTEISQVTLVNLDSLTWQWIITSLMR